MNNHEILSNYGVPYQCSGATRGLILSEQVVNGKKLWKTLTMNAYVNTLIRTTTKLSLNITFLTLATWEECGNA